jgi:hypothetical protein
MAKEILANQRVILTYIKGNANGNMKYESSSSVNMHDNNQINGGRSFSNNRNPFSTLNKENFHTAPIQNGTKEITPTQVKRNNELLNFIGPAIVTSTPKYPLNRYNPMNSSRIQNPKQSLGNGAHAQNNMNLFSSNGKADAQKNFPKRQDLNVTLPKKMKLAPDVNSTPSQRRGPGRPFGSTKQSLIPQVNKLTVMVPPNKAINEARKIPAKENNNQTLGDHLGMKAPKVCYSFDLPWIL